MTPDRLPPQLAGEIVEPEIQKRYRLQCEQWEAEQEELRKSGELPPKPKRKAGFEGKRYRGPNDWMT